MDTGLVLLWICVALAALIILLVIGFGLMIRLYVRQKSQTRFIPSYNLGYNNDDLFGKSRERERNEITGGSLTTEQTMKTEVRISHEVEDDMRSTGANVEERSTEAMTHSDVPEVDGAPVTDGQAVHYELPNEKDHVVAETNDQSKNACPETNDVVAEPDEPNTSVTSL